MTIFHFKVPAGIKKTAAFLLKVVMFVMVFLVALLLMVAGLAKHTKT